jgi:cytochrome b561
MHLDNELIGWCFVATSALITLWRRKSSFDNPRYSTYWKQLTAKTMDGFCSFLSLSLLVSGVLLVATEYKDSWGAFVLIPAYCFMIFLLIGT